MKKYFTEIGETEIKTELELLNDSEVFIDGKKYEYESKFINNNVLVLRIGSKNYFVSVTENENDNTLDVNIDSEVYNVNCKSDLDIMIGKMTENKGDVKTKKEIRSPMPGIIKSLTVTEGQKVSKGQVLLVLEAMKMENEIKAAKECTVKKISVTPMSSVEKNELLLELE